MKNPIVRWLEFWHGARKEEHQYSWYRCASCNGLVTWNMIEKGGCSCGSARISPTRPRLGEQWRLIFLPWTV